MVKKITIFVVLFFLITFSVHAQDTTDLQKKISDYNIEISKLKTKSFDYRKRLASLDPTNDITTFEAYTQNWAEVQNKIAFLAKEVKNFKKLT